MARRRPRARLQVRLCCRLAWSNAVIVFFVDLKTRIIMCVVMPIGIALPIDHDEHRYFIRIDDHDASMIKQ